MRSPYLSSPTREKSLNFHRANFSNDNYRSNIFPNENEQRIIVLDPFTSRCRSKNLIREGVRGLNGFNLHGEPMRDTRASRFSEFNFHVMLDPYVCRVKVDRKSEHRLNEPVTDTLRQLLGRYIHTLDQKRWVASSMDASRYSIQSFFQEKT